MNNLQKLYQTIFEAGLINNSFEDFSQGMLGEDYQKKYLMLLLTKAYLVKILILLSLVILLKK